MPKIRFFDRAAGFGGRVALYEDARSVTYDDLLNASAQIASHLLREAQDTSDLGGDSVAYLIAPSIDWISVTWGIWRAGGTAVPLALGHPPPELDAAVEDSRARILVATPDLLDRLRPIAEARGLPLLSTTEVLGGQPAKTLPEIEVERSALLLYTSGTTGRPKGVVIRHDNLEAQIENLVDAWQWSKEDHIPAYLPLHHVHGIVNVLSCALWSGASAEMFARFDAEKIWDAILSGRVSVFMAVPTIYNRLITAWEGASPQRREALSAACRGLRLMVSGSAALPVPVLKRWREISGHVLLERYGMTEIGMALSNSYEDERIPGAVGRPLPSVEIRLVDEEGEPLPGDTDGSGEIEVRGPSVFREYLGRPEATDESFRDGWFRTGDQASRENGIYRILGRRSVDIIKTGGEKVSALEIESKLREHPAIADCAVVGISDPDWGERVAVAVICRGDDLQLDVLRSWGKERLALYKVPSLLCVVEDLPRNAMGKVTKPAVKKLFGPDA